MIKNWLLQYYNETYKQLILIQKELEQVDDRTLIAILQAREYAFATFTLDKIDTDSLGYDGILMDQVKSEQGNSLWTRWLMITPQRVIDKALFNHLIRLINTDKFGYYNLTTNIKALDKVLISLNIDYIGRKLELYIYFSFKTKNNRPRAVQIILYRDLPWDNIKSNLLIINIIQLIKLDQKVIIKIFSYPAFNGMIADVRGFLLKDSKEQFQKVSQDHKPNLSLPQSSDIFILQAKSDFF